MLNYVQEFGGDEKGSVEIHVEEESGDGEKQRRIGRGK